VLFVLCTVVLLRVGPHSSVHHTHTHTLVAHAIDVQLRSTNYSSPWYHFNTPKYERGNVTFNITGALSFARPDPNGCTMDDTVRGKIVLAKPFSCSSATKIDACQAVGCLAVIEHNNVFTVAGYLMWSIFDASFTRTQLHAPCAEINPDNGDFVEELMRTPNSEVIAVLSSTDSNPYGEYYTSTSFLLIRIFFVLINGVGCLLAVHRMFMWWKTEQTLARVAWAILIFETLANLERCLYFGKHVFKVVSMIIIILYLLLAFNYYI